MTLQRLNLSYSGIGEILRGAETRAFLTDKAEAVLAAAKSIAPVESGAYRDSLTIVQDTTDRAAVRVTSSLDYAMVVEARTGTLSRALDAAGG